MAEAHGVEPHDCLKVFDVAEAGKQARPEGIQGALREGKRGRERERGREGGGERKRERVGESGRERERG